MSSTQQPEGPHDEAAHGSGDAGTAPAPGRRGRRTPLVAASVAAAVLVVAGGAAYLAAGSGGNGGGQEARPPLHVGPAYDPVPPGGPVMSVSPSPPGIHGIAPGDGDPRGTVYRVKGPLPDGPDSARVYDRGADVSADRVAKLAGALGVSGTPHTSGQFWQVGGASDGSGPVLRVQKAAPGTWTFSRFTASPGDDCAKGKPCPGTASGAGPGPDPGGVVHPSGTAVSEAAAERTAAPVLKAVGQGGAHLDAGRLLGAVRVVNADPVVAGLPTYGWTTGLQVGADGRIESGGGQLALPGAGTSYPVTGAAQALRSLNQAGSRTDSGGCATPGPPRGGPVTGAEPVPTPSCSSRPPVGERTVPVDSVVFGLAARAVDGRRALVPSWLFTVDPGGATPAYRVTQPAVAPAYLAPPGGGMRPGSGAGAGGGAPSGPGAGTGSGTDTGTGTGSSAPDPGASPSGAGGATDEQTISYTTSGRDLTVSFWGGVCGTYGMRTDESGSAVTVHLEKPAPKQGEVCMAMAKRLTKTVTLKRPVGDRDVVSATTGAKVPHAAP